MNKRHLILSALITIGAVCYAVDPINTKGLFNSAAIKGYDPVAYFTQSKAVKGQEQFTYNWKGADWHFSSQENLDQFKAAPEKFEPQYGGYCAYAMSNGEAVAIDPDQFTILEGKLYLNYSSRIQKRWNKDRENYIELADKNWPDVLKQ